MNSGSIKHAFFYQLYNIYAYIVFVFRFIYVTIHKNKNLINDVVVAPTILTETDKYTLLRKSLFIETFAKNSTDFNSNIQSEFYSKKTLQENLIDANNEIETTWERRILLEFTPRGNIVMYYDAYKLGFVYYSDTNCLPYALLNAVAMKYVTVYKCRDFFMDESFYPDGQISPLINVHILEPVKEKNSTAEKLNKFTKELDVPFASLKQYKKENATARSVESAKKEQIQNKFINQGKMMNFKFLQKPDKKSPISGFSSNLLDNVVKETKLQKEVMNYAAYKKILESNQQ